ELSAALKTGPEKFEILDLTEVQTWYQLVRSGNTTVIHTDDVVSDTALTILEAFGDFGRVKDALAGEADPRINVTIDEILAPGNRSGLAEIKINLGPMSQSVEVLH